MYLIALILPPLAVAMCGKPWQALVACILSLFFWFPGVFYAWVVIAEHNSDRRNRELIGAVRGSNRTRRNRDDDEPKPNDFKNPDNPFSFD